MQPNQSPNQFNQNAPPGNGAYDFLYTQPEPPPRKPSLFAQNKKFILIAGGTFIFLILLGVVAAVSSPKKDEAGNTPQAATTTVPLKKYDGQYLSMSYADSLLINIDEQMEDPIGWYLDFAENPENSPYDISIQVDNQPLDYTDGEVAVKDTFYDSPTQPFNIATSDILLAGVPAKKTVADYRTEAGESMRIVYTAAQAGDRYITVRATYPADNLDISDSFDAMVGSIILK